MHDGKRDDIHPLRRRYPFSADTRSSGVVRLYEPCFLLVGFGRVLIMRWQLAYAGGPFAAIGSARRQRARSACPLAQFITFLLLLTLPALQAAAMMQAMDRLVHTSFFAPSELVVSGSQWSLRAEETRSSGSTNSGSWLTWKRTCWSFPRWA